MPLAAPSQRFLAAVLLCVGGFGADPSAHARPDGRLALETVDKATGQPIAVRMQLRDARGRIVRIRPPDAVVVGSDIYFDGSVVLELNRGAYTFFMEAGPEYQTQTGNFTLEPRGEDSKRVEFLRQANLQREGWLAADLDLLPLRGVTPPSLALMKRAVGIHWTPLDAVEPNAASSQETLASLVIPAADDWLLPVLVAQGKMDAVQIFHRELPPGNATVKSTGFPLDKALYPGKSGPGRFAEAVYHHLLNCGLRLPPAAGTGLGTMLAGRPIDVPLGANRVYAQCGGDATPAQWCAALQAGRVFVTNGPLLRTRVEGFPPGNVFVVDAPGPRKFEIALDLSFYQQSQVEYLDVLQDGKTIHNIRLADFAAGKGRLPPVVFTESGWFAVRAVANQGAAYQYAASGPYYVEFQGRRRVSRDSVQYFLDWLDEGEKKFAGDEPRAAAFRAARPYWQKLER